MADLGEQGFDATQHEATSGGNFEPLPKGDYLAAVSASEWKTTNDGEGRYLSLTFEVLEGDYRGRLFWLNLNLKNKNPKAVQIANNDLAAICLAVGKPKLRDSAELHDVPLVLSLRLKRNKNSGEMENAFGTAKSKDQAATPATSQPATGALPWQK